MFKFKKQTYSEDMFADTRMSFGDHLEDLRIHLWRALYWFFFMIIGVFVLDGIGLITSWRIPYTNVQIGVGYPMFRFIIAPIRQELSEYRVRRAKKVLQTLENDPVLKDANRARIVRMSVIREQLALALQGKNPDLLPPLPEEGQPVEFSLLVGRAQLQAATATEALYAHRWPEMKSISQGLQAIVDRLPGATNVPEDVQGNFTRWSEDLAQNVTELNKQAERGNLDKAEKALQQIQTLLGSREMVSLPIRIDEPVRFFVMISQAEAEVNQANDPVSLSPMESFMGYFKVALLCGLVLGSPWIFYHLWTFIAAGLYPHE